MPDVNIVASTPVLGTGLDRDLLSLATHVVDSDAVSRDGHADVLKALDENIGGVSLSSASGNPYQPGLLYHGFAASPLQGTAQGIAVYVNGVRFNQAFGDTVNWDMIPGDAIEAINLQDANPVFGLNALGGALAVRLKDGFTSPGGEAETSGGSFGRIEAELDYGSHRADRSFYVAATTLHETGWRDLQSSDLNQMYGDVGWRDAVSELHINLLLADAVLNGPGTAPVELLAADSRAALTSPNAIHNRALQTTVSLNRDISDVLSLQTTAYYGYFLQRVSNGNVTDLGPCGGGRALLCTDDGVVGTTRNGLAIPDYLQGGPYSELDDQTTNTNSFGVSAQISDDGAILRMQNHLAAGVSFDGAQTEFGATSLVGGLVGPDRVFVGPGIVIDSPGLNQPVRVAVADRYGGVFASDTISLTRQLSVTAAARLNLAEIDLSDQGGGALTGAHAYRRLNPSLGLADALLPGLTVYGSVAGTNRAPTPAELSCASPSAPCTLANFFVGDPDLKQVVGISYEIGLRGHFSSVAAAISYDLSLYQSDLRDDIVFVNSPVQGRAFFQNVGSTRRRGLDAAIQLKRGVWRLAVSYSYIEPTFRTGFLNAAGDNPAAGSDGTTVVRAGDRLPGIPPQQLKATLSCDVTSRWTADATAIASSGQYLYGDEANLTPRLPAYFVLNLAGSFKLTSRLKLFGQIENATAARYYTYGTFSPTSQIALSQAPGASNPRSVSIAAPISFFGGVRWTF